MESLVHYQTMLVQRHNAAVGEEECERLRAYSLELLQQLEAQDPLRMQRYRDIGQYSVITIVAKKLVCLHIHCVYSVILSVKSVTSATIPLAIKQVLG